MRIALILMLLLSACQFRYGQYNSAYAEKCISEWKYIDIMLADSVKVLLFSPKHQVDLSVFPNFLIGVNNMGDTIGCVDRGFTGDLKKGQIVIVEHGNWSPLQKEYLIRSETGSKDKKINRLFCSVKTVYYVKIRTNGNE